MFGVTPPISTDPPKPADIQSSEGELGPSFRSPRTTADFGTSSHGGSGRS